MKSVLTGYKQFRSSVYPEMQSLFSELAGGQKPHTLLITCADSRICPDLLLQANPGELFVHRNVGNLVAPLGSNLGSEIAAIEFAVEVLGVQEIVVCGHSDCGAVKAALSGGVCSEQLPGVCNWLDNVDLGILPPEDKAPFEKRLNIAIRNNVRTQIARLREYPSVQRAVADGKLNLHGMLFRIETAQLEYYFQDRNEFSVVSDNVDVETLV